MARRRQARGTLPDRRRRRPRRGRPRESRAAAVIRACYLAASPGQGDARRAIVPRDFHPCEPSLSSGGMNRFAPLLIAVPLLLAASAPVQIEAETVDQALKRARAEAQAADSRVRLLEQAAGRARGEA